MPTIKKIRKLIKSQENGLNSSKSSEDDDISVKTDDEKPVSEEDILESLGLKHVARTPDGKIDHAKLSMKDRMAIVRGMQKLNSLSDKINAFPIFCTTFQFLQKRVVFSLFGIFHKRVIYETHLQNAVIVKNCAKHLKCIDCVI